MQHSGCVCCPTMSLWWQLYHSFTCCAMASSSSCLLQALVQMHFSWATDPATWFFWGEGGDLIPTSSFPGSIMIPGSSVSLVCFLSLSTPSPVSTGVADLRTSLTYCCTNTDVLPIGLSPASLVLSHSPFKFILNFRQGRPLCGTCGTRDVLSY